MMENQKCVLWSQGLQGHSQATADTIEGTGAYRALTAISTQVGDGEW